MSVYPLLTIMIDQLAAIAWQKLGLQIDPITGKIHQDLSEAKVAIDLVAHLSAFVEPRLDDEDRRRLHALVRDLRLNFVQKSQERAG